MFINTIWFCYSFHILHCHVDVKVRQSNREGKGKVYKKALRAFKKEFTERYQEHKKSMKKNSNLSNAVIGQFLFRYTSLYFLLN